MSNTSCVIYYFLPFFTMMWQLRRYKQPNGMWYDFPVWFLCALQNKRVRTKGQMECKIPRHSLLMLKKNKYKRHYFLWVFLLMSGKYFCNSIYCSFKQKKRSKATKTSNNSVHTCNKMQRYVVKIQQYNMVPIPLLNDLDLSEKETYFNFNFGVK